MVEEATVVEAMVEEAMVEVMIGTMAVVLVEVATEGVSTFKAVTLFTKTSTLSSKSESK